MAKSPEEKLKEIEKLLEEKRKIDARLFELISPTSEAKNPPGFSYPSEVIKIIRGAGSEGITAEDVLTRMRHIQPAATRKRVGGVISYLMTRKQIVTIGRGAYRINEETPLFKEDGATTDDDIL